MENTSKINAILLDKTSTLTEGKFSVTDIIAFEDFDKKSRALLNDGSGMEIKLQLNPIKFKAGE